MIKIEELTTKDELIRSLGSLSLEEDAHLNQEFDLTYVENEYKKISKKLKVRYWGNAILLLLVLVLFTYITIYEGFKIKDFLVTIIVVTLPIGSLFSLRKKQKIYQRLLEVS